MATAEEPSTSMFPLKLFKEQQQQRLWQRHPLIIYHLVCTGPVATQQLQCRPPSHCIGASNARQLVSHLLTHLLPHHTNALRKQPGTPFRTA